MENKKCAIFNFWNGGNYGAVMTAFALCEILKKMGLSPYLINYDNKQYARFFKIKRPLDFAKKYLNITSECCNKKDLSKLNKEFDIFIVGSDQVWQWFDWWNYLYYLDFVETNKKKIAISASFGVDFYRGNTQQTIFAQYFIKRFDSISVREKSGIDICNNIFNVNADFVLDPVFLYDKEGYENLIKEADIKEKDYILNYTLDNDDSKNKLIENISKKLNKKVITIKPNGGIENWLYLIKNADFVITDSFHGTCFSIIFNKNFISIKNKIRGNARFESILNLINLEESFIDPNENYNIDNLIKDIDYDKIEEILEKEKEKSRKWIKTAIEKPKDTRNETVESKVLFELLKNKKIEKEFLSSNTPRTGLKRLIYGIFKIIRKTFGKLYEKN